MAVGGSAVSVGLSGWLLSSSSPGTSVLWEWAPQFQLEISWRLETGTLALAVLVAGVGLFVLQYAGVYFAQNAKG